MNPVFLHGWGMQPGIWQGLQTALGLPDAPAPALRAQGGDMHDWADRIASELPPEATLIAWSLSSLLALDIAARHPGRVRSLVLIAATPCFVQRPGWAHGLEAATVQAFREGFLRDAARTQERFIALQAFGDTARHKVSSQLREQLDDPQAHNAALAHGLRLLEETDLRSRLPEVTLPCLFIHGLQDSLVPAAASIWLGQRWPGSEYLHIADAGHAPFISATDVVARRIGQFIHAR